MRRLKKNGMQALWRQTLMLAMLIGLVLGAFEVREASAQNSQIAEGAMWSAVIKNDGTVWTWGSNGSGQLGNGTMIDSAVPVQVSGLGGVTAIAAGRAHVVALKTDGTVWTWGYNNAGQLGNDSYTDSAIPVKVAGLTGVTKIAANESHTVVLKNDGTVWAWGENRTGLLGNGSTNMSAVPVKVIGLGGVTAIASGAFHTIALKNDGSVWTWGDNSWGLLGNDTSSIIPITTPAQVPGLSGIIDVAAGIHNSIVQKNDGTVWTWGSTALGVGYLDSNSVCPSGICVHPVQITGLSGVTAIAAKWDFALALKSDGTVWAWGENNAGQLGNGTYGYGLTPVQVTGLAGVTTIDVGYEHSTAVKSNGTVLAWGWDNCGQLGNGTITANIASPVQVQITGIKTNDNGGGSRGGTPVPVMDGWWLLPGMLAGLGIFVRNRKGSRIG
jgi:alpha-tubulin suppressor-like RCC1 family protein